MPPGDARYHLALKVFFDVDDTLISWEEKLRPNVHEVFQQLKDDGHDIYIWSGMGIRQEIVDKFNLQPYISGIYRKPVYSYLERLHQFTPIRPDFIVDDHPEIVEKLGGVIIRPPTWIIEKDKEMWRIYDAFAYFIERLRRREEREQSGGLIEE